MNAADLQRFCADKDHIRYYLCKPWSRGEYTYATNGYIMVFVKRLPGVEENEQAPDCEVLILKTLPGQEWMPVPVATMPPNVECHDCNGTGIRECNAGYEHDCGLCDHTGKIRSHSGMRIAGVSFDQGYLSMIQGWEIAPNDAKPAWIRNGDALGLLMPMRD